MDRSRIPIALALALALFSIVLAIVRMTRSSSDTSFEVRRSSFFEAGRSGLARIKIHGMIQGSKSMNVASASQIISLIREAQSANAIRGVILDIDSGGGETVATKQIFEAVKELKSKKPVIAVIGSVAASGGYYIASAADRIFALETSVVGSIGVITLHPNISGLLEKIGVSIQTMKTGAHKDSSYPFRNLSADEQQMYADLLDDAYQVFIADVSEGRKQSQKTVIDWAADGKIYSGKRAKAMQMIDDIGGEKEALQSMKLLLKTDDDLLIYEPEVNFLDRLFSNMGIANLKIQSQLPSSQIYYLYPTTELVEQFLPLSKLVN